MRFVICVHPDKGFREILLSIWERLGWDIVEVLHGLQIQDAVPIQVLAENKIIIPVAMLNEPVEFRVVIDIVPAVENLASLTLQLAFASTLWIILVFIFIVPHFEYKGAGFGIQLYFSVRGQRYSGRNTDIRCFRQFWYSFVYATFICRVPFQ